MLFSLTGLSSPKNTQHKMILNFANKTLIGKNSTVELKKQLCEGIKLKIAKQNFDFTTLKTYIRQVFHSIGYADLYVIRPRNQSGFFPGNVPMPFRLLPNNIKALFGTGHFHRAVKVFFKYRCPHRDGINPNKCKNCVEVDSFINRVTTPKDDLVLDVEYFSIVEMVKRDAPSYLKAEPTHSQFIIFINSRIIRTIKKYIAKATPN